MIESPAQQPHEALALRSGQQVFCRDGHAGHVTSLLLDPRGQVRQFVMRLGHLGHEVIVPVDWVGESDAENVHLSVNRHALEGLPGYRPDSVIAAEVDRALWNDDVLREGDYHEIDVVVSNGVVSLNGYVMTLTIKARVEQAARTVHDVSDVENHLIADDQVVIAVAQALDHDAQTREQTVYVSARNGIVSLSGEVSSAAVRAAVEECAASVPVVRGVLNYVQALGVARHDEEQRVLQPQIGAEVYASDIRLGRVERAIISPHNRRVTAFVAHGQFPEPAHSDPSVLPVEMLHAAPEWHRVIPINAVSDVNASGVLLRITSGEAARLADFDPARFVTPDANWQLPYPYHLADVMLEPG
jgi:osmotically-inducible protein OsmY